MSNKLRSRSCKGCSLALPIIEALFLAGLPWRTDLSLVHRPLIRPGGTGRSICAEAGGILQQHPQQSLQHLQNTSWWRGRQQPWHCRLQSLAHPAEFPSAQHRTAACTK